MNDKDVEVFLIIKYGSMLDAHTKWRFYDAPGEEWEKTYICKWLKTEEAQRKIG